MALRPRFHPFVARTALPALFMGLMMSLVAPAGASELTLERMFGAPDLSGPTLRGAQISPDGKLVTYLRGKEKDKDRLDLWAYDIGRKQHRVLVDSASLAPKERALSAEEEARRERQRISALTGIVEYSFSADSRYLLVPLSGDLYVYDLRAPSAKAVRRLTATESYETDARFSPRGRYVSFIRDQNLIVYDLKGGVERAITQEGGGLISFGVAEFIAQEEMDRDTGYWWSPDDTRIAYTRVDETPVAEVERFEIYADNVKVVKQRYPFTGARNAQVQLFVTWLGKECKACTPEDAIKTAATPLTVRVDLGAEEDFYLARVDWFPDSSQLAVQHQTRDQKTLTLLKADAVTGQTSPLLTERSDTWVELNNELTFLKNSPRFIWASRRNGFKHLYLYDLDGKLLRPLTSGEWMVTGECGKSAVCGVDEARGRVYFMANAQTPLERHLYAVSLNEPQSSGKNASGMQRLTQASGWHAIALAQSGNVYLDTFSTPEQPPSVTLRSMEGAVLATLVDNTVTGAHPYTPFAAQHQPAEFGTLQAVDGQTLHYQLIKPRNLVSGKRYPVVVDVYGGPGAQRVRRAWSGNAGFFHQLLAQDGYVVFLLDNRGSAYRGVRFETALYKRMGTVEVEDQVKGVEFLKSLPYVDPKRIGIFGWSYGGYMALLSLMQAPDAFAAAVSGAPVTDWKLYDTHYTERFMSIPKENETGYAAGNVLNHADKLSRPLLIIHGMADDNVLFTHSTALFKKLQDLNKPFDVMTYPGSKHALLRHNSTGVHGYATIKRFFDEHLKE